MADCVVCGTPIDEPLPISRQAYCPHCKADLHACRQCGFYDPTVANECRETQAEWVSDKEKSNFCGFFKLHNRGVMAQQDPRDAAKSALDKLFKRSKESV